MSKMLNKRDTWTGLLGTMVALIDDPRVSDDDKLAQLRAGAVVLGIAIASHRGADPITDYEIEVNDEEFRASLEGRVTIIEAGIKVDPVFRDAARRGGFQ